MTITSRDIDTFVNTNANDGGLTAIVEKRHDARTADMRVIERRRKPRQTREQFYAHVAEYCAKKGKRR
jgi:hypothetical protein